MGAWYEKGLRFECARCGKCCRGEAGYVWVTAADIIAIAGFVGVGLDTIEKHYVRHVGNRISLVEKPNGDCVFWENAIGCMIYPIRPTQCRTFPFWARNTASRKNWEEATKDCEGVGKGRLYKAEEIEKRANKKW